MRIAFLILLALLTVFAGTRSRAADTGPSFACGLNAAYILLNRTGHHAAYDELQRDFEAQTPPDSMLAIHNVLAKHGCATLGVKVDAGYFFAHKGPVIVYLKLAGATRLQESHFSCMVAANRQAGAEFLDPVFSLREPAYLTWDTFTQAFQGDALILQ